jgi:DNA-binding transcriptional ArsR family regulator
MPRPESRKTISDVKVLAVLSHPIRVQLLDLLLGGGARTATECAEVVGISASACSYHLRHMARFGFVERVEVKDATADGRERPWHAAATGFSFGGPPSTDLPAMQATRQALEVIAIDESARLAKTYVNSSDRLEAEWRDAAQFATYGLMVTPTELAELGQRIDGLLRPYIAATRKKRPADGKPVRVTFQAFKRTDSE